MRRVEVTGGTARDPDRLQAVEFGILAGTLALCAILTLLSIGTQIRTVVSSPPAHDIGEP